MVDDLNGKEGKERRIWRQNCERETNKMVGNKINSPSNKQAMLRKRRSRKVLSTIKAAAGVIAYGEQGKPLTRQL